MRKNPHYIHNCFPSSFIDFENKESIDTDGNTSISVVAVKRNLEDVKTLPIDAYPTLDAQLKAGITPEFVNPVINTVNAADVDNSDVVNNLLEQHSEHINSSTVSSNNNDSVNK